MTTLFLLSTLVTAVFGMNTKSLRFTDTDTALLWATVLMIGSAIAVCLMMWRPGIFHFLRRRGRSR
jgi:Mg2+ and Co2+ transporter CorA